MQDKPYSIHKEKDGFYYLKLEGQGYHRFKTMREAQIQKQKLRSGGYKANFLGEGVHKSTSKKKLKSIS